MKQSPQTGNTSNTDLITRVLDFVQVGGPGRDRTCDQSVMSRPLYH